MKIRKKTIIISIIFLIIIFSLLFITNTYAINFIPDDYAPNSTTSVVGGDRILSIGNIIVGVVQTVASIVSVAALIIIGIKYMMGSAEEKAEYKKTMLPYVIAAILTFGITNILAIVIDMTKVFTN